METLIVYKEVSVHGVVAIRVLWRCPLSLLHVIVGHKLWFFLLFLFTFSFFLFSWFRIGLRWSLLVFRILIVLRLSRLANGFLLVAKL